MEFRIWYLNAQNNEDRGYRVERENLNHLAETEGKGASYNFECEEMNIRGCIMNGKLLAVCPLKETR